ncbi:MAG: metallophosphoesterase family protein [Actinomycetota bacterium]
MTAVRVVVLSDIHSNLEALEAVLVGSRSEEADLTVVLGDIVGYGADPEATLGLVRSVSPLVMLAGNHDLAAAGGFDLSWFNPVAAAATRWTAENLSPDSRAFLRDLPVRRLHDDVLLVHGSVVDPVAEYVVRPSDAARSFGAADFAKCLFGHTHVPAVFMRDLSGIHHLVPIEGESIDLPASSRWMCNPGSVGQPRDGDARAAYMVLDVSQCRVTLRRVAYDVQSAQRKICAAGLPEVLAARLEMGR